MGLVTALVHSVCVASTTFANVFMNGIFDKLSDWMTSQFSGFFNLCYKLGLLIWNALMSFTLGTLQLSPSAFSWDSYYFVMFTLHDWLYGIGATMLNVMFYVGLVRSANNLKQNITFEIVIEALIKVVLANLLLQFGRTIISNINNIASGMTSELGTYGSYSSASFATTDVDPGSFLFYLIFGIVFLVVAVVSAVTIFLTVYTRYLEIYMLIAAYPIAIPTIAGGQGISQTAAAWVKTYLSKIFASVVILLAIMIAQTMMNNLSLIDYITDANVLFDGAYDCICNMLTMVVLAGAVKGTDTFLRRTFAL